MFGSGRETGLGRGAENDKLPAANFIDCRDALKSGRHLGLPKRFPSLDVEGANGSVACPGE
jgi:hypothetical protein